MNQEQIISIIRQLLLVAGGSLVTKGYLDAATLNSIIGAVLILGGSAWAIYSRRNAGLIQSAASSALTTGERITLNSQAKADAIPSIKVVGPAQAKAVAPAGSGS